MQRVVWKVSCILLGHLFKRHSVNTCYMSGTVLGTRDRALDTLTIFQLPGS